MKSITCKLDNSKPRTARRSIHSTTARSAFTAIAFTVTMILALFAMLALDAPHDAPCTVVTETVD